jgi:hypothetical protein
VRCERSFDPAPLLAAIRAALIDLGVADAAVTVAIVPSLSRQDSGKFRRFVPLPPSS